MRRGEFCAGSVAGSDRSYLFGGELTASIPFASCLSSTVHPVLHVLALCTYDQMRRVNTARVIADMPYNVASWISTVEQSRYAMRSPFLAVELEDTIAVFVTGSFPLPALIGGAYVNLFPEPFSVFLRDPIR